MKQTLSILRFPLFAALFCLNFCIGIHGQQASTKASLIFDHTLASPGSQIEVALELQMPDHWHTYWKNPGQSGMATEINWKTPDWFIPGEIQWPVPERFGEGEFTTYGYGGTIHLIVPVKIGGDAPEGTHELEAEVTWLECDELCLPGRTTVSSTLTIEDGNEIQSEEAPRFSQWRKNLPDGRAIISGRFQWVGPVGDDERSFHIQIPLPDDYSGGKTDYFPGRYEDFDLIPDHENRTLEDGHLLIGGRVVKYSGDWPESLSGLVVLNDDPGPLARPVTLKSGTLDFTPGSGTKMESPSPLSRGFDPFGKDPWGGESPDNMVDSNVSVPGDSWDSADSFSDTSISSEAGSTDFADPASEPGDISETPSPAPDRSLAMDTQKAEPAKENVVDPGEEKASGSDDEPVRQSSGVGYPLAFLLAFGGGIILNFMPCVLPVVFLKIMGFVKLREESPKVIRSYGVFYLLGVLACYLLLALILIGLRASGREMGFGFQFTSPYFLMALTLLTAVIALNLFGVFEVIVSGKATTAATKLSGKTGNLGAFWGGCFTTLLGTPCMAPGLAAAAGVALSTNTPPMLMILLFLTMGFGLALPYVLASFVPAFIRILPKPGLWMHHFKVAMGFPMAAASIWLLTLNELHYGKSGLLWVGMLVVAVSLLLWIFGTFVQKATRGQGLAWVVIAFGAFATWAFILESRLDWRNPSGSSMAEYADTSTTSSLDFAALLKSPAISSELANDPEVQQFLKAVQKLESSQKSLTWQKWSPEAVEQARQAGRPVFVDFTASWCVNCKENKRRAIDIPETMEQFRKLDMVLLRGDYSLQPPEITAELQRFNVGGVPLNLLYGADPEDPPVVLPTYLTPDNLSAALGRLDASN